MHIYLAPLRGLTDFIYRNTLCLHFKGLDGALAPFITTVRGKSVKLSHIKDILPKNNSCIHLVPQLIGNEPSSFVILADKLFEMGYKTVNWNLGCPYPMVIHKKRGAGLLPYPELIENFLAKTLSEIKCQLSVKMRLGCNDGNEYIKTIPVLNKFSLSEVILHPRTAKQMYKGDIDLDAFEKCLELSSNPVVFNGDITDKESFKRIKDRFETIDRIMIGRGMLMRPYLAEMIKSTDNFQEKDLSKRLASFHADLLSLYGSAISGQKQLLDKMKQLWRYLSFSFDNREQALKKIQRSKTLDDYRDSVENIFKCKVSTGGRCQSTID